MKSLVLSLILSGFTWLMAGNVTSVDVNAAVDGNRAEHIRKIDPRIKQAFDDQDYNTKNARVRVIMHIANNGEQITFESYRGLDAVAVVAEAVASAQDAFISGVSERFREYVGPGRQIEFVDLLSLQYAVVATVEDPEFLDKLAQYDGLGFVEYDNLNTLFTDEGRALTGSDLAAQSGYTGSGVGVAVIDSHFDLLHPELGGTTSLPNSVVKAGSNFSDPGTSIHSQNFNDCYHGTGTASIVHRYAPNSSIYALTVFPNAYDSVIANAINWCITNKNGTGGGSPIKVISMSLGGSRYYSECNSGAMHTAATNALSNGIIVFAASGNDGWTNSMGSPACSNAVISVGSVWDEDGAAYSPFPPANCNDFNRLVNERTCYSDTASFLDIYAPSEEVMCARCGGGTWALGGTSSACPAAAGMTAQFLQAQPSYAGNKSGLLSVYQGTGVTVVGDTSKRRIDLAAALNLGSTPAPTASLTASPTTITEGQSATLSWTTSNATSASINNGVGAATPVASGSRTVSPTVTTTYTLTATGDGGTSTASATIVVNSAGGGTSTLDNGVSKNYSLTTGNTATYTMAIPANASNLTVTITGSGDADLYVKRSPVNWPADQGQHNEAEFKAPYASGSAESVTFASPAQDTWNVLIHGYSGNPSGTIVASWTVSGGGGGTPELANGVSQNYSTSTGSYTEYVINVPANASDLTVTMTGSGDADLYVKRAAINWPGDQGRHDEAEFKSPYLSGSAEEVVFPSPAQDTWHVLIYGYSGNPSGTIVANWTTGGGGGGTPEWHYEALVEQTPHNYANNKTYEFTYSNPSATQVGIHFEKLYTEANYDFLYVYDQNGTQLYKVSGNLISSGAGNAFGRTDGWVVINGNSIRIRLVTDYSVTKYGYKTDWAGAFY
ncbi:MAG: hypothetical protein KDC35_21095 [Acidobacteria bacterium]|nr:hypothetical protein [Acidobacteriota bacterium]